MRRLDTSAGIGPLFMVLFIIVLVGLLLGIFGLFLTPIMDSSNNINSVMSILWMIVVPGCVLIGLFAYAVVKAQRPS